MVTQSCKQVILQDPKSRRQIEEHSGQKISTCFQCEKCTNGCPLTFAMDIFPHQVIHRIHLGSIEEVLNSDTIWVCASCETCTARCPNDIDIAHVMDTLRQMSTARGVKPAQKQAPLFHSIFLSNVKRLGRMHEMSMALEYALKSEGIKGISKQAGMGLEMMRKGKLKLIPGRWRAGKQVEDIFRTMKGKKRS
jgi:heterodisulfide reductase subunit C2